MKRFLMIYAAALFMLGCGDSGSGQKEPTEPTEPPGPEEPVEQTCETMSCAHGCCDNKCVDLQSDVLHCGRCETKCDAYCKNGECTADCSGDGAKMCDGLCVDITKNALHCGKCNNACGTNMVCTAAGCQCVEGYSDCDGNAANGCESHVDSCECVDGATMSCYPGPEGTENVGECRAGRALCEDGLFLVCEDYVEPFPYEIPENGKDDNCDGRIDELVDEDGDGYPFGYGAGMDCCDSSRNCNAEDPSKVNPAAIEVPGNGIDDDCDGMIDEDETVLCSTEIAKFTSNTQLGGDEAKLLARAMDICTDAVSDGYGLVSAEFLLADGSALPVKGDSKVCGSTTTLISPADQAAVVKDLGNIVKALNGTMAVLSSGKAQGNENTGYRDCVGTEVLAPKEFLDAHGGVLPVSAECYDETKPPSHKQANDSIMLRLKLKAPSTAKGFTFRFKFFSKEYPDYVCNNYNDFFLAMTDAKSAEIPADRNVSFDKNNNPVSVNNAFFTECDKDACKKEKGCSSCEDGYKNVLAYVGNEKLAGATDWLKTSVPVSAGEEFTLDLIIFDAGDYDLSKGENTKGWGHQRDSLVLIDNFEWLTEATSLITVVN